MCVHVRPMTTGVSLGSFGLVGPKQPQCNHFDQHMWGTCGSLINRTAHSLKPTIIMMRTPADNLGLIVSSMLKKVLMNILFQAYSKVINRYSKVSCSSLFFSNWEGKLLIKKTTLILYILQQYLNVNRMSCKKNIPAHCTYWSELSLSASGRRLIWKRRKDIPNSVSVWTELRSVD